MPRRALGPCTASMCPGLAVDHGKCERHAQERDRQYNAGRSSAAAQGYGRSWEKARAKQLDLYPYCQRCSAPAIMAHHLIPKRAGGPDTLDNLVSLCHGCHSGIELSAVHRKVGR